MRRSSTAPLSFLAPVEAELSQVEARIRETGELDFPWLEGLLTYVLAGSGKRLRPAITLLTGRLYRYQEELHVPMAAAMELLHVASLVHDDTVDNAGLRRGRKTVNALWAANVAILLGDYLFSQAADLATSTGNSRLMRSFAHTLRLLTSGELRELRSAFTWPQSQDYYLERISRKTASLFATAAEAGAVLGDAPEAEVEALREFGTNLGMAFQIVDDILDFRGQEEEVGKPVGNDLLQGVLTLPAILFLERHAERDGQVWAESSWEDPDRVSRLIEQVRDSAAIGEAYQIAEGFCQRARAALISLQDSRYRRSLLEMLDYTATRTR